MLFAYQPKDVRSALQSTLQVDSRQTGSVLPSGHTVGRFAFENANISSLTPSGGFIFDLLCVRGILRCPILCRGSSNYILYTWYSFLSCLCCLLITIRSHRSVTNPTIRQQLRDVHGVRHVAENERACLPLSTPLSLFLLTRVEECRQLSAAFVSLYIVETLADAFTMLFIFTHAPCFQQPFAGTSDNTKWRKCPAPIIRIRHQT